MSERLNELWKAVPRGAQEKIKAGTQTIDPPLTVDEKILLLEFYDDSYGTIEAMDQGMFTFLLKQFIATKIRTNGKA